MTQPKSSIPSCRMLSNDRLLRMVWMAFTLLAPKVKLNTLCVSQHVILHALWWFVNTSWPFPWQGLFDRWLTIFISSYHNFVKIQHYAKARLRTEAKFKVKSFQRYKTPRKQKEKKKGSWWFVFESGLETKLN